MTSRKIEKEKKSLSNVDNSAKRKEKEREFEKKSRRRVERIICPFENWKFDQVNSNNH